jgi:hypothetical protein
VNIVTKWKPGGWLVGPAVLGLAALAVALPLLLLNSGDGSYTCRGSAIGDVIGPEPQESTLFRQDFFGSGWQCNRQARQQVAWAGIIVILGAGASVVWARRRRSQHRGR